ncbi:ATP-binding protein [Marinivivus vitaminiproducens]|uniref:ATP-binding protein n=1 Tax=Marinivivus vitaminiproducens TaxID=3035935 RepID=UPI003FA089E5
MSAASGAFAPGVGASAPRGRLKIFLGAAPGVGKTYEMLLSARARQKDGVDVVVGVVETHGRAETEALLGGLEAVPRRRIDYRGHGMTEMDLDAILARRPALVLVDELAHTNAPGSRHPKRHQDVEDLLAAGIDVFTTVNIQHVESLNDVVARITRIRVRETVPDAVLDRADDIEIVDIAPDDLMQRLREGKVYVPHQAARALDHYFSAGNLTALRELALRRTAQRVDEQLLRHMQDHAIQGPWAAGERVLVCVSEDPKCAGLIRYAKRLADQLHAPWTALYVETARSHGLSEEERDRIADALRLAERLGADAVTEPGSRIVDDLLTFACANNVTQIVIGKSDRSRWFEMLHGSVVHDLVRRAAGFSVHVVAGEAIDGPPIPRKTVTTRTRPNPHWLQAVTSAIVAVALALGVGKLLEPTIGIETVDLVFLTAVIAIAVFYGLWVSLFASVLAALAYNFFFLDPLYTFAIAHPTNVAPFLFFLVVALVVSHLAARVHAEVLTARNRARTTEALYAFSRKIAGVANQDDLLWATVYQMASMLKLDVVLLLPRDGVLEIQAGYPPEDMLDEADLGAAKWAFETNKTAGRGADTLPGGKRLFLPMRTANGVVGVVGLTRAKAGPLLEPDQRRLLDALMDQSAVAIERIGLARQMDAARLAAESERLRSALLASLSHDLKTPLASILGAVTSLRQFDSLYDADARDELAATIQDETERMSRFVANLLDMTRIESGGIVIERAPLDLGEIVATALERTKRVLGRHRLLVDVAADLPLVTADAVLLEQVLVNLLDNAAKHTPQGTPVTVEAARDRSGVRLRVLDEGPGIAADDARRIFEKFQRARDRDRRTAGTGLGLAICKGFIEAIGGSIEAANRTDRPGAVFTIHFPPELVVPLVPSEAAE